MRMMRGTTQTDRPLQSTVFVVAVVVVVTFAYFYAFVVVVVVWSLYGPCCVNIKSIYTTIFCFLKPLVLSQQTFKCGQQTFSESIFYWASARSLSMSHMTGPKMASRRATAIELALVSTFIKGPRRAENDYYQVSCSEIFRIINYARF